jgi:hypothetical protein
MNDLREIKKLTKTELILLLKSNIGKLLTIRFKRQDGSEKTVNGQYTGHITELGYHQFKAKGDYNLFDAKNLLEVRVNKIIYQLKK